MTHTVFSITTNLLVLEYYHAETLSLSEQAMFISGASIGGVLADIDKLGTTANHLLPKPLQEFFAMIFQHRKQTHRVYAFFFLCFIFLYLFPSIPILFTYPFLIGYASHLLGDCLTKQGLQLFEIFGLFKKTYRFYIIRHEYIEVLIQYLCFIYIVTF